MRLYFWARCDTCRAAQRLIAGATVEERDFFRQRFSQDEMEELAAMAGGVRRIFSSSSPSFRKLGRKADDLTEEEMLRLMLEEPRLVRRPLLWDGSRLQVGLAEIVAAQETAAGTSSKRTTTP